MLTRQRKSIPRAGGLPASRRAAVALALACAGLAALLITVAIGHYKHNAQTAARQDTVLVATQTIQKGSSYAEITAGGLFKSSPVTASNVSAGAISDAGLLEGRVAAVNIVKGQQLTLADFATTSTDDVAVQLPPGNRGIEVSLDSAHGIANALAAGDHVDVYGDFNVQNVDGNGDSVGPQQQVVKLIVPNAVVLRDSASGGGLGSSTSNAQVVLSVGENQTAPIAYASDNGQLWLFLRPPNAGTPSTAPTTITSILLGQTAGSALERSRLYRVLATGAAPATGTTAAGSSATGASASATTNTGGTK